MPPNYDIVPSEAIELLAPGDDAESGKQRRHIRSVSSSSFVHFKSPQIQQEEEETHKITNVNQLASQALPSLLICVIGLIVAGWMMDIYQHWEVFTKVSELFILVPVLLNLKGNLEMNLAARFSTSANLGDLDNPTTRNSLVWGNLSLIQVQALISGCIAGIFSVVLGMLQHPNNVISVSEIILVVASSMVSASVSSLVLGVFMCVLIILSRILRIDPDNIACPMASSLGDVVTLFILAECANILLIQMNSNTSSILLMLMFGSIPFFGWSVWRNPNVKGLLFSGWTPIIIAMLISSGAGLVLERYVEQFKGLAMLTPILCGLSGNLGSIYASRISTCLHKGLQEQFKKVEWTLMLMNVPVQIVFLFVVWGFDVGHLDYTVAFALSYFAVSMISTFIALKMGKSMTLSFWKYQYDPDNYVLPYLTAIIDVICTSLLVVAFTFISSSGHQEIEST